MNLTVERSVLLKALTHVQSVVERRNTIPILANVLLEAEGQSMCLTATDMDISIVETAPADVAQEGAVTLGAHTLYEIVRKLKDGAQVSISTGETEGRINLSAGRTAFELSTLPKEDFPTISTEDLPESFSLTAEQTRTLIDQTRFAISTEETRYYLNGIYLHIDPEDSDLMKAVATDGHRLALYGFAKPEGLDVLEGIIVPRKTIGEMRKLIDDLEGDVKVSLSDSKIHFSFANVELTSKLIDGTFPDYQRVIPKGNDKSMQVPAKAFAEAVDRVATISSEKSRAVKLEAKPGIAVVTASSPELGTASDELEVNYDGPELQIGFNARYLLDITTLIGGSDMTFEMMDSVSPTLVKNVDDEAALFVLMPMRV